MRWWPFGCRHDYMVILQTTQSPVELENNDYEKLDSEQLERLRAGTTTLLQMCKKCGEMREWFVLGVQQDAQYLEGTRRELDA